MCRLAAHEDEFHGAWRAYRCWDEARPDGCCTDKLVKQVLCPPWARPRRFSQSCVFLVHATWMSAAARIRDHLALAAPGARRQDGGQCKGGKSRLQGELLLIKTSVRL